MNQKILGVVETDMAILARAAQAHQDLEAWLLSLPTKRRITPDDTQRLDANLHHIGAGLAVIRKYLARLHTEGWPPDGRSIDHA